MLKALKKLMILSITTLSVVNSAIAGDYLKIKSSVSRAKVYYKKRDGGFIHKSYLANKRNRVFRVVERKQDVDVCNGKDIVLINKIGWVCSGIFEFVDHVPDGYVVYGQQKRPVQVKPKTKVREKREKSLVESARYESLRKLVGMSQVQHVKPDNPQLVVLSKNYTNRIMCKGQMQKVIHNKDHLIEIEYDDHNIFIKAPKNKMLQFLSDLVIKCDDNIYQLNTAYDSALPGQQVVLDVPEKQNVNVKKYAQEIKRISALDFEVKVARLLKMAYLNEYPGFWIVKDRFNRTGDMTLLREINTNVDKIHIYDFVLSGHDEQKALEFVKKFVVEVGIKYIATGLVKGENSLRVLLVAQEVYHAG